MRPSEVTSSPSSPIRTSTLEPSLNNRVADWVDSSTSIVATSSSVIRSTVSVVFSEPPDFSRESIAILSKTVVVKVFSASSTLRTRSFVSSTLSTNAAVTSTVRASTSSAISSLVDFSTASMRSSALMVSGSNTSMSPLTLTAISTRSSLRGISTAINCSPDLSTTSTSVLSFAKRTVVVTSA